MTPNILALLTSSSSLELMMMVSQLSFPYTCLRSTGACCFYSISLHQTLLFLGTTSVNVVSSTYFHKCPSDGLRSLIIRRNNHGPNFVPCGTPDGTAPHSEKQSLDSLTRCSLFDKKSHTQRTTLRGTFRERIFLTRIR